MGETKNSRKDKVLFALVILGLIAALLFAYVILPKMQEKKAAEIAAESSSAPSAEAPPVAESTTTPTPAPTQTEEHTGDDAEFDFDDENAGFTSTTDRKPESGDAGKAKAVINEVMPRWAGIDLTGNGIAPDSWAKEVARPGGVDSAFTAWSQTNFYDLWGGVIQMGASAEVLSVKADKELWNVGSHSMWRVSVTRSITNDSTGEEIMQETVTWDILVAQDEEGEEGFVLSYFALPDKSHEKPETFYLPPLPRH